MDENEVFKILSLAAAKHAPSDLVKIIRNYPATNPETKFGFLFASFEPQSQQLKSEYPVVNLYLLSHPFVDLNETKEHVISRLVGVTSRNEFGQFGYASGRLSKDGFLCTNVDLNLASPGKSLYPAPFPPRSDDGLVTLFEAGLLSYALLSGVPTDKIQENYLAICGLSQDNLQRFKDGFRNRVKRVERELEQYLL